MTGVHIGMKMKYLPWQLFVPLVIGGSLVIMYYAFTIKGEDKVGNVFFFFLAIGLFLIGIETLAKNTGIFVQYLPIIEPLYWGVSFITLILMLILFLFSIVS